VDWDKVPKGQAEGEIVISGANREFVIKVPVRPDVPQITSGFIEKNGIVSIDAINFQDVKETEKVSWDVIPNLGRTGSAITTKPVTSPKQIPGKNSPYLEYKLSLLDSGIYSLEAWFSPTLNFQKDEGLSYAFSIDDGTPQVTNLHKNAKDADWTYPAWWNDAVTNNIMKQNVLEMELSAGTHTLRYWVVDPGVVLQKMVLKRKGVVSESYLGPPESTFFR
jgi:hypothetical protein